MALSTDGSNLSKFVDGVTSTTIVPATTGTNSLFILGIYISANATPPTVTSITATGATFSRVGTVQNSGANTTLELWTAPLSAPFSNTITINFSASAVANIRARAIKSTTTNPIVLDTNASALQWFATSTASSAPFTFTCTSNQSSGIMLSSFYETNANASGSMTGGGITLTFDDNALNFSSTLSKWTYRGGYQGVYSSALSSAVFTWTPSASCPTIQAWIALFSDAAPPPPASISISPASLAQGGGANITVTGTNTHFASGTTAVSFSGSGVTAGTITVASATSLTVATTVSKTAAVGSRTVTVTTGTETPTATLTVTPGQRGDIDFDQVQLMARQGGGGLFQMFGGGTTPAGSAAIYDSFGNVISSGTPLASSNLSVNGVLVGVVTAAPNYNDSTPAAPSDGSINVRWQYDASGNVSANFTPGARTSYTPTVTPQSAMTISGVTVPYAYYVRMGPLVYVAAQVHFTCSGTLESYVNVSLPVAAAGIAGNGFCLSAQVTSPSVIWVPGLNLIVGATIRCFAGGNANTLYTAAAYDVMINGWYWVA
jgi:YD repeat-containing protein